MKLIDVKENDTKRARSTLFLIAAALVYLVVFSTPGEGGWLSCPFRALTGYSCPGCGMTRASAHALHGNFAESLQHHPLAMPVALGGAMWFANSALILFWRKRVTFEGPRWKRAIDVFWWLALVAVVLHGAIRLVLEVAGILTPI